MITEKHYTKLGEHPEDRIFRDKEYIKRLQKHIDSVYEQLKADLRMNDLGDDLLFDYVFNCDDKDQEFEDQVERLGYEYHEIFREK